MSVRFSVFITATVTAACGGSEAVPAGAQAKVDASADSVDASAGAVEGLFGTTDAGSDAAPDADMACPASIAEFCGQSPNACPTWNGAQAECVRVIASTAASSCGAYHAESFHGPPDTGGTTFYFDAATRDLIGIAVSAGNVPPPWTFAVVCTVPHDFEVPQCTWPQCDAGDAQATVFDGAVAE